MAHLDGLGRLVQQLMAQKVRGGISAKTKVNVGYSAPYALFVHENLEMWHMPPTQAKFLETPLRKYREELYKVARRSMNSGKNLPDALLDMGEALLLLSKELVPVKTGFLRDSGFVEIQ